MRVMRRWNTGRIGSLSRAIEAWKKSHKTHLEEVAARQFLARNFVMPAVLGFRRIRRRKFHIWAQWAAESLFRKRQIARAYAMWSKTILIKVVQAWSVKIIQRKDLRGSLQIIFMQCASLESHNTETQIAKTCRANAVRARKILLRWHSILHLAEMQADRSLKHYSRRFKRKYLPASFEELRKYAFHRKQMRKLKSIGASQFVTVHRQGP